jgi:hypothetical protein
MVTPRWPRREMMNPIDKLQNIHVIFNGSKVDHQRRSQNREGIELNDKLSVYKKIRRRVIVGFPFFVNLKYFENVWKRTMNLVWLTV